jgi:hypothetical protein
MAINIGKQPDKQASNPLPGPKVVQIHDHISYNNNIITVTLSACKSWEDPGKRFQI